MKVWMIDSLVENEYTYCLCEKIACLGIDVNLVCTSDRVFPRDPNFNVFRWLPSKGGDIPRTEKLLSYFEYLMKMKNISIKNTHDIMHFQFFRLDRVESLLFPLLATTKIRTCHTVHNLLPHEFRYVDKLLKYIVYKSADHLIVHSSKAKSGLSIKFDVTSSKISVIPHGDFDIYLPQNMQTKKTSRSLLGLSADDDIVLFFGKIKKYKGLGVLLDAFDIVCQNNSHARLVVAGSPSSKSLDHHYQQKISKMEFSERIVYHPKFIPSDNIPTYMIASDIVALPYRHIDHSGVLHMAQSFGRPVVATKIGDFEQILRKSEAGYLAQPDNARELAKVILVALDDKKKLARMGRAAKNFSKDEFSWEKIAKMTIDVYNNL